MYISNVKSVLVVGRAAVIRTGDAERPVSKPAGEDTISAVGDVARPAPAEETRGLVLSNADTASAGLTPEEQDLVDKLQARDREVRQHEEAHARVGGAYAGQPSYAFQSGPDGKRYAVGGEVPIDVSPIANDPEATIEKMRIVKAAALAPAEPSAADRRIAQLAEAQKLEAMGDVASEQREARANSFVEAANAISTDRPVEGTILSMAA